MYRDNDKDRSWFAIEKYLPSVLHVALFITVVNLLLSSGHANQPIATDPIGEKDFITLVTSSQINQEETFAAAEQSEFITEDHYRYRPEVSAASVTGLSKSQKQGKLFCELADDEPRVQVIVARPEGRPSRLVELQAQIQQEILEMNGIFNASAQKSGGSMLLKVNMDENCWADIIEVELPPEVITLTSGLTEQFKTLGFNKNNEKYLIYLDGQDLVIPICGRSTIFGHSIPGQDNFNNTKFSYAVIAASCWVGPNIAHEMTHSLGGVQKDAPNSSKGWHGTDEYDIMSYSDPPDFPTMRIVCPGFDNDSLLDCENNDFLHADPPSGSYLFDHWNIYRSQWAWNPGSFNESPLPPSGYVELNNPSSNSILVGHTVSVHVPFSVTTGVMAEELTVFINNTPIYTITAEEIAAHPEDEPFVFEWRADGVTVEKYAYFSAIAAYSLLNESGDGRSRVRLFGQPVFITQGQLHFLPLVFN